MKNLNIFYTFTTLLFVSCGKEKMDTPDSMSANRIKAFKTFSSSMQKANIDGDFNRLDSVGKGFKSITGVSANHCLENQATYFTLDPSASIDYQTNLSQQQLLSKIGVGVSAGIPVSVIGLPISISPEASYARDASVDTLSRTGTVTIKIIKGKYSLGKVNQSNSYKINEKYAQSLHNNTGEFYMLCGDRVISQQNAEASLVITTIFRFNNSQTKNTFDGSIGTKIPNPFSFGSDKVDLKIDNKIETKKVDSSANNELTITESSPNNEVKPSDSTTSTEVKDGNSKDKTSGILGKVKEMIIPSKESSGGGMAPGLKLKLSTMSQDTLKNVTIEVKAIQIGGDPRDLPKILTTVCSPADLNSCDKMFADIQNYAANSFPAQLEHISTYTDESSNNKFTRGGYVVVKYSDIDIVDSSGNLLSELLHKYTQDSQSFINLKHDISEESQRIVAEYNFAQGIKNKSSFDSLTIDEKETVGNAINISQREEELIQYVSDKCFQNKENCHNVFNEYKNFSKEQKEKVHYLSEELNNIKAWNLIASTEANWRPVRYVLGIFSSDRMTSDFFSPTHLRGYKKFFIKYVNNKEPNKGYKITKANSDGIRLNTSFRCYNWFSDSVGTLWLHEREPNETIELGKGDELVNLCGSKTAFACTFNRDLEKISPFLIQIWAE